MSVDERTIRARNKYARALAEVAKIEKVLYEKVPEKDHALLRDYALTIAQSANVSMVSYFRQHPIRAHSVLVIVGFGFDLEYRFAAGRYSSMPGCWASHAAVSSARP